MLVTAGKPGPLPGPNWVCTTFQASSTKSTSNGRVSRGSIISSMPKAWALRNGDEMACRRASICARFASGIRRVLDVPLVGDGGAALDMHRAAVGGRPAVAPVQAVAAALVKAAGDPVELAQDEADVGCLALGQRGDDPGAGANDAEFLLGPPHREARLVGEVDQRQVEGVAQFDQADGLLARWRCPSSRR